MSFLQIAESVGDRADLRSYAKNIYLSIGIFVSELFNGEVERIDGTVVEGAEVGILIESYIKFTYVLLEYLQSLL